MGLPASCPEKELLAPRLFKGEISTPLAATDSLSSGLRFIAFPPGGEFELYTLKERAGSTSTTAADSSARVPASEAAEPAAVHENSTAGLPMSSGAEVKLEAAAGSLASAATAALS